MSVVIGSTVARPTDCRVSQPWRWALAVMLVQLVVMVFTSGSSFGLLPLGLVLFGVLALPPTLAAQLGAWLRQRRSQTWQSSA